MLRKITNSIYNKFGWRTKRKLIVFTSDDWGSIRVKSNIERDRLIADGFAMDTSRFNRFDTLESNIDLEQLFEVLKQFRDAKGNHPVITAMTNVANPDFEKIRENDFKQYFFEPFTETLKKYPQHDRVYDLYKEGISKNIFVPQFHGREHLNVARWMAALQSGHSKTRLAFDAQFYMLEKSDLLPLNKGFGPALDLDYTRELPAHEQIIREGLSLFEKLFGYKATFFTAPSMMFNDKLEPTLNTSGITMIDVPKFQKMPTGNNSHKSKINFIGHKNKSGSIYVCRNSVFEPNMDSQSDGVNKCLLEIENAFRSNKPAILSNHRAAFVGGLDESNRVKGLAALHSLFDKILTKWPDAEFVSTQQLEVIMRNND